MSNSHPIPGWLDVWSLAKHLEYRIDRSIKHQRNSRTVDAVSESATITVTAAEMAMLLAAIPSKQPEPEAPNLMFWMGRDACHPDEASDDQT